ncbi:unnamed protein product [Triticum aestivum]|uniref:FAD/NAD(P)-binding domain-containing protein n=3 Tax=Triticinae TaxID=1648030 RepID=A0A9R1ERR2_WHEAT|nr:glutathione reductase, cytosolic [Aegilops tauschii subsp. strangulata]XP_044331885.1 glutathione reductase, cytosolic-like [Triticum aestivum]KAF7015627.1 hypothetical protein CFC21_029421 [Triticum aestivum]SPT17647.1 unnamed protein product [Triticum aestivum]
MARKMLKDGEAPAIADGGEESYDYDLFVIGAGSGVLRGSRTAAGFGAKVAICELPFHPINSDWLGGHGGTCVIHGCLSKKILVHQSYSLHHVAGKSFGCRTPRISGGRSMATSTTTGKSCWKTSWSGSSECRLCGG